MAINQTTLAELLREIFDRLLHPCFELHLRLPAEHCFGLSDIRLALLGVVFRHWAIDDLRLTTSQLDDFLREL